MVDPEGDDTEDTGVPILVPGEFSRHTFIIGYLGSRKEPPATIRRNPPVTVEDWPEPPPDDLYYTSDSESDIADVPSDASDQDPPFIEQEEPPAYHPDYEPEFSDQQLRELLELHLGTMDEAEWLELCTSTLFYYSSYSRYYSRFACTL